MNRNNNQIANSATILTIASVASPATGVLVETVLAWRYGVSFVVDGFRIAYLLIAFGGALFFAQLLPNVIIPIFAEIRGKHSDAAAWRFAMSYGMVVGGCLLALSIWVWTSPQTLFHFLGPGLTGQAQSEGCWMLRYFVFSFCLMVWSGVMNGVLNAYQVFAVLPSAQFLANLVLALSILLASTTGSRPLIIGVVGGALLTVIVHVAALGLVARQVGLKPAAIFQLCPGPVLLRAVWLSMPLVGMIAVQYYTIALYNRALSHLGSGSIAEMGYAWKMLTLASFVPTALATVIFSNLSITAGSDSDLRRMFDRSFRMTLFITVPLVTLLYIHKFDIVSILLTRGAMAANGAQAVANLYGVLLLSAPAITLSGIVYKFLYVKQTTIIPAAISIVTAMIVFWILPYASQKGGVTGVAAASSICTWLGTLLAIAGLGVFYRIVNVKTVLVYTARLTLVTVAAMIPSAVLVFWLGDMKTFADHLLLLAFSTVLAGFAMTMISRWCGIEEAHELLSYALSRITVARDVFRRSPQGSEGSLVVDV